MSSIALMKTQKRLSSHSGTVRRVMPKTPVMNVIGRKSAAMTVRRFMTSFMRLETVERYASSAPLISSR